MSNSSLINVADVLGWSRGGDDDTLRTVSREEPVRVNLLRDLSYSYYEPLDYHEVQGQDNEGAELRNLYDYDPWS